MDSINISLPSENVTWERAPQLGMMEFYQQGAALTGQVASSPTCPHEMPGQAVWGMVRSQSDWLYPIKLPNSQTR